MAPQEATTTRNLRETQARTALLGWSLAAMEACHKHGRDFIAVVPSDFATYMEEHDIPYETWDFGKINEQSVELAQRLKKRGVEVAVPLYEETVEWAGALNAQFRDDPRVFNRAMLFRDKAMMKRKAQIHGIRVGIFEEVDSKEDVRKFLKRVNEALLKLDTEVPEPVHLKPHSAAGTVGHRMIRNEKDIDEKLSDDDFPLLAESHLDGQEFSCEAFIHDGKVRFLNITEYVHLGYSNFIPAGPELEAHRDRVMKEIEKLVDAFGIRYGVIHPEYFLDSDGTLKFGEVAARVPGGHIFDLIERAYGFSAYYGMVLCSDPMTTEDELQEFFPEPVTGAKGHAGCVMVYPKGKRVDRLEIPETLEEEPYFERHDLLAPIPGKVAEAEGFGGFYGTVYFFGDDPDRMRDLLLEYEQVDFYPGEEKETEAEAEA